MEKRNGKRESPLQAAKRYVDEQLAVMKKHGTIRTLSSKEYGALVQQIVDATAESSHSARVEKKKVVLADCD